MAGFRKPSTLKELDWVMSTLNAYPLGKQMCQIVKDIVDKRLEANIYVDQWPNFTTVISQEFRPRLSEVADLRIYTTEKERILPLINEANLLDNIGTWQLIHYVADIEGCEELSTYLLEALKQHDVTKVRTSVLMFDYKLYEVEDTPIVPVVNLLSGFQLREVPPTAAEFISKHWVPATIEYPLEHRLRFIKDTIAQFEFLGVYRTEDNRYPVAWSAQKPGGVVGLGYTLKEYRHNHFSELASWETVKRNMAKGNHTFYEFLEFPKRAQHFGKVHTMIGHSQIIAIY